METFVDNKGVRLWTAAEGEGVPVLLCNGGPGCCDYLSPVAELMTAARVVRFEQRGCGRSDEAPPYTFENTLDDMEAIRRHYGWERFVVAGHSWGADLALIYALRHPKNVLGFICLAGGRMNNDREWSRLYHEREEQGLEPPLAFAYPPNLEVNAQLNAERKRYVQRPTLFREIANLNAPALFVYGERDIRPSWPVEQVAALMPSSRFEKLSASDHYLWQSEPERLKSLLNGFLTPFLPAVSPL